MKNYKILIGLFFILTAFTFTSCENEPIDSAIDLDDFNQQCDVPTAFQASNFINNNSVSLSWVAGGDEAEWTVQYGIQGFVLGTGTSVIANTTTYVLTGLNSSNSYSFYLKSNCSTELSSQWVGPINVQGIQVNPTCSNPSSLTAVRNSTTNTNVDLSWTAGGTETSWEIQYGATGFSVGSGTSVVSTTSTKQISNILTTNAYDFYVRAKCSANQNSNWIGPINVAIVTVQPTIVGYMNANVNGVQYNQMKPAFYTITGLAIGVSINSNIANNFKLIKIQGNSDPFLTTTSGVEINLFLSQQYWTPGTYVLKSGNTIIDGPEDYPYVDLIIQESGTSIIENEIPGTITLLEFSSVTRKVKGTFSFTYNTSSNGNPIGGPFTVTNGEFEFSLKDEVFN